MTDGSRHATKVNRAPVLTLWAARSAGAGRAARLACTRRGFLHGGDDAQPAAKSGLVLSEGRRSEGMVAPALCFIDKTPAQVQRCATVPTVWPSQEGSHAPGSWPWTILRCRHRSLGERRVPRGHLASVRRCHAVTLSTPQGLTLTDPGPSREEASSDMHRANTRRCWMRFSKLVLAGMVSLVAVPLSLGVCAVGNAQAQVVRWDDIRGVSSPIGLNVDNTEILNAIGSGSGSTDPGQRPWSTKSGSAKIQLATGRVDFAVHGLVLAGGVGIGTTSPFTQVLGRLVCDLDGSASDGNSVLVDTPVVPLSPQGDAAFLGNVGPLPAACSEPDIAFLLVNPDTDRWIAFGAVRTP